MTDDTIKAITYAAVGIFGGVLVKLVDVILVRMRAHNAIEVKQTDEDARGESFSRRELQRYMADQRTQTTTLTNKIDQMQSQIDAQRTQITDLTVKLAIAERDKAALASDNAELVARVTSLEAQVARISPRGVGSSAGDNPLHP